MFDVPKVCLTDKAWDDTGSTVEHTASQGMWVKHASGIYAYRKPGIASVGNVAPLREFVCTSIAHWLEVPMPKIELLEHPTIGPCSLSYELDGDVYKWFNVIDMRLTDSLYSTGLIALQDYAPRTIVLDILVGGCDRLNRGNHLFVQGERRWYGIDYGFSFNQPWPHLTGVGDPKGEFATMNQGKRAVFKEIEDAVKHNPGLLKKTLALAHGIPDTSIEGILHIPPDVFGDPSTRTAMIGFLKYRRDTLDELVRAWCGSIGLNGVV